MGYTVQEPAVLDGELIRVRITREEQLLGVLDVERSGSVTGRMHWMCAIVDKWVDGTVLSVHGE